MQKAGDRYFSYGECTYYALPFSIKPTEGEHDYRLCDSCQETHKEIVRQLKKRVKKFPNCCETHKRLLSLKEFNRSDFRDAAEQCADSLHINTLLIDNQVQYGKLSSLNILIRRLKALDVSQMDLENLFYWVVMFLLLGSW